MLWVLCDINSAYVSFCQLFNPQFNIETVPLGVLSSNQGNIVARNQPMKDLGIKMGEAAFKIKNDVYKNQGHLWGSNFEFFGDMSHRFHTELEYFLIEPERYSVDEAFGRIDTSYTKDVKAYAQEMQSTLKRNLGLGCGIGISHTRTLAKAASHCAKIKQWKHKTNGVVFLDTEEQIDYALERMQTTDIWGVGRKIGAKLSDIGVHNALQLKQACPIEMKSKFNVVLARTIQELNKIPSIDLKDPMMAREQICVSRSMGKPVAQFNELKESIATHTAVASKKARQQLMFVSQIKVFISTNPFSETKQYSKSIGIDLPYPTSNTLDLTNYALYALKHLYKAGYEYKKTGVILSKLVLANQIQTNLFEENSDDKVKLKQTEVMDSINDKFGKGAIRIASAGLSHNWKPKDDLAPPSYTTRLDELVVIN